MCFTRSPVNKAEINGWAHYSNLWVDDEADPGDGDKKNAGNINLDIKKVNMEYKPRNKESESENDEMRFIKPDIQVVHAFLWEALQIHTLHILLRKYHSATINFGLKISSNVSRDSVNLSLALQCPCPQKGCEMLHGAETWSGQKSCQKCFFLCL